jgi:CubicO group peptidase (beta-lactamase class C family)
MKRRNFAMGLSAAVAATPLVAHAHVDARDSGGSEWPTAPGRGDFSGVREAWNRAAAGVSLAIGQSDAFLVVQDGKLVFERYGADGGPAVRHISWSMAKSITHALVGIAVGEGRVDIDRPLRTVPQGNPNLCLRSLLTLTDGLSWNEGDYSPETSDAAKMLYGPGRFDGAAYTAAKTQAYPPGRRWNYSTGAYHLAAAELQANLFPGVRAPGAKRAAMAAWMDNRLFAPLGMTSALGEFDAAGTFVGGSLVYATARDFARFGELYRLDGVWEGKRILPRDWVRFARTPTVQPAYGAGFWLEAKAGNDPPSLMGGTGPMDGFSAQGHNGQVILIVPSKAVVLVRLGLMDDGDAAWKALGAWLAPTVNFLPDTARA